MKRNERYSIEEQVISILEDTVGDGSFIEMTDGKYTLNIDSLDMVEIMLNLEREFDISLSDVTIESFKTVGDVVNYISNYFPDEQLNQLKFALRKEIK